MSTGTYLAVAAAIGTASEATGTTAFTPLGEQAREDGPRAGLPAPNPGGGVDLSGIGEALAAASDRSASIGAIESQGELFGQLLAGQQDLTAQVADTVAGQGASVQDVKDAYQQGTETATERTEDVAGSDVGEQVERLRDYLESQQSGGPSFDAGDTGSGGSSFLGDVREAGDMATDAGQTGKDTGRYVLDGVSRTGSTVREASRLLATGEADVAGTLDPRANEDVTKIERPTVTGAVKDRLPSGGSDYDGPTLEEKAAKNVKEELTGWL